MTMTIITVVPILKENKRLNLTTSSLSDKSFVWVPASPGQAQASLGLSQAPTHKPTPPAINRLFPQVHSVRVALQKMDVLLAYIRHSQY